MAPGSVRTIRDRPYVKTYVLRMEFGGCILCAPTPLYDTLLKAIGDCHNQSADWFRNDSVFLLPGADLHRADAETVAFSARTVEDAGPYGFGSVLRMEFNQSSRIYAAVTWP